MRAIAIIAGFVLAASIFSRADAATVVTPDQKPTAAQSKLIKRAMASLPKFMRSKNFTVGIAHLSVNGKNDLIVHYFSFNWCGSGGCAAIAILPSPIGSKIKIINLPLFTNNIFVLNSSHNGMHDLTFDGSNYKFTWSGNQYR